MTTGLPSSGQIEAVPGGPHRLAGDPEQLATRETIEASPRASAASSSRPRKSAYPRVPQP
jgi:hypothetical protein